MTHSLFTATFRVACKQPHCPFCWVLHEDEHRYMRSLLHEYTLAPDIHAHLAASRGFCIRHARMLVVTEWTMNQDGLGTATLYTSVLQRLETATAAAVEIASKPFKAEKPNAVIEKIAAILRPQEPCLACLHARQNESFALKSWIAYLAEEGLETDLAQSYAQGHNACFPHLQALMSQKPPPTIAHWLLTSFSTALQRQHQKLAEYIRKQEVRYRHAMKAEERFAWKEAVEFTIGDFLEKPGELP